ncbi:MAG TPA: hypothetical protein VG672_15350, partial [Bryobacteraceae bacterium]|nr:hypothetical protein [Bryobacteraceae bacterium]
MKLLPISVLSVSAAFGAASLPFAGDRIPAACQEEGSALIQLYTPISTGAREWVPAPAKKRINPHELARRAAKRHHV